MAKWRCIICGWAHTAMEVTTTSERMNSPRSPPDRETNPLLARSLGGRAASAATFPRAADLGEDGPHEHEHTHEHDDALHGFGVEDAAQSADEDGEPYDDRHQPDGAPRRARGGSRPAGAPPP